MWCRLERFVVVGLASVALLLAMTEAAAARGDRYNDAHGLACGAGYLPDAAFRDRDRNEIPSVDAVGSSLFSQPAPRLVFADGVESGAASTGSAITPF